MMESKDCPLTTSSPPLSPVSTLSSLSEKDTEEVKVTKAPKDFKTEDVIESDSEWEGTNDDKVDDRLSPTPANNTSHFVKQKKETETPETPSTSAPPATATGKRGSSGSIDKFLVLEEISSSEDNDEFEVEEEESCSSVPPEEVSNGGDAGLTEPVSPAGVDLGNPSELGQAQNEKDVLQLIQALEKNPNDKRICFYCYRAGHITVGCEDKRSKERRQHPYWRQGVKQRRYIFYDMNPVIKNKHTEYKAKKNMTYARNRVLRQGQQEADQVRNERDKLKTVQELLEMAQALME